MKHQYFGDVSDYKKYSVLRAISNNGQLKTMVCWMLTRNDTRNDGNVNKYLQKANEWRQFEPDIFDFLYDAVVVNQTKDLRLVEQQRIVPSTNYFWQILTDNRQEREKYFNSLQQAASGHDVVFLDPDNGIATGSVIKGRKNSSKYVFMDEIEKLWEQDHSLLIYQHFPRVDRMQYIKKRVDELKSLGANETYAIKTNHMVYFLVPQEGHISHFGGLKERVESRWGSGIEVHRFQF